ncbi:MAG TPA: hypothetical protein DCS55_11305 [Acidimicrobiaceae bacterium]|nr:hypothetical protein [Acidimicrobiaceae bacterium]
MFFEVQPGSNTGDRRYRELVEQLDMPMLIHVDGTIVFATQAVVDLVRVEDLQALKGRQLVDFIHPDDLEVVVAHMVRVLAGEPSERHRYRIRRADGTDAWVAAAATPYLLGDVAGALVVIEDITARLDAEAKLRASEVRYRALVQNSADIVAIVSAEGRLTYVSPATAAVLGREVDEVAGTDVRRWLHLPRPRRRRRGARRDRGPDPALGALGRHGRPGRGRRVRPRAAPGRPDAGHRGHRGPHRQHPAGAHRAREQPLPPVRVRGDRLRPGARHHGRGPAARRGRRHVPSQAGAIRSLGVRPP